MCINHAGVHIVKKQTVDEAVTKTFLYIALYKWIINEKYNIKIVWVDIELIFVFFQQNFILLEKILISPL